MSIELIIVCGLLAVVIVLFAMDKPRMDAVALMAMCVLPFTGIVSIQESVAGFGDPNIILIAAMFVVGEGLVRTGVTRKIGDWLLVSSGKSTNRLIILLMLAVGTIGATMSSTAVAAIFIPIVLRICQRSQLSPSKLMMPLSIAALVSGMMTLVATTPNLIVNAELIRRGEAGFKFLSFTPFGVPILLLSILYMLLMKRWLPSNGTHDQAITAARPTFSDWIRRYQLGQRKHRLRVERGSPLVGRSLEAVGLRSNDGANVIAIQRNNVLIQPTAKFELQLGDVIFLDLFVRDRSIVNLAEKYKLEELPLQGTTFIDSQQEIGMAEVFLPADSELVGKTIISAGLRTKYGFSAIGLRRGVHALESGIHHEELKVGDILLVVGPWKSIRQARSVSSRDLIALNLPAEFDEILPVRGRALHAVLVLLAVVAMMVSGVVPNAHAALIGCLLLGATGCITLESAYSSIDWKTIVLIVGMLPFSLALERTGGVQLASDGLLMITQGVGSYGILAALFATTVTLGLFISNTATAVLMTPVALALSDQLQSSPYPFAMIVALASSTAFITPVSSPVNTLVVTPGGYRFIDFVRIGLPFALITMTVSVVLIEWLLPL